jgi:D-alanine-D-alanine ligase
MRRDERPRVAVIGGAANCEHDVSLASASAICEHLDPSKYDVVPLTIGRNGCWYDGGGRPVGFTGAASVLRSCDVALPAVHGPRGEDGTLAALCELAGLPYVGSGVAAGAIAMDKWATKLVAEAVGVATAPGQLLTAATAAAYAWCGPVIVKPVAAGSSHGVTLVDEPDLLAPALDAALALDTRILVEEVVVGREIDIAVLARPDDERVVSPPLEIAVDGIFDHATKYGGQADFRIPADLDEAQAKELTDAAVAVFDALGCAGVARIDFFLTATGWVLNEVNTMPGFTEASQVPKMFAAAGLGYADLLDLLVTDALRTGVSRWFLRCELASLEGLVAGAPRTSTTDGARA